MEEGGREIASPQTSTYCPTSPLVHDELVVLKTSVGIVGVRSGRREGGTGVVVSIKSLCWEEKILIF